MTKKTFFFAFIINFLCMSFDADAQTDPNNWDKLNLSSKTIAGAKVYYEKSFEPNLPFFEKMYKQALAAKDKQKAVSAKKEQVLADINRILGIKEPLSDLQEKAWKSFSGLFPSAENMTFYLVKQSAIKNFLRSGGKLPNFTYDKADDSVYYNLKFPDPNKGEPLKNIECTFPIESAEKFENNVENIFKVFHGESNKMFEGIIIHEITEMSMLAYVKQTDPYWRWFSDGFSDAITYELLKKHFDSATAEEYLKYNNPDQYSEIKKEINLRYWTSAKFELGEMPTEKGKIYEQARYAYSTSEARRLIDKYGIDCVQKILNEIAPKQSRNGDDLIATIKNVTGEDVNDRLAAYQSFNTRQEGVEKYAKAFNDASQKKDYEQMVFNLFRMHDLRPLSDVENLLNDYRFAAVLLFKMGFEQQADTIIQNCMQIFSNPGFTNGRKAAAEVLMIYALETEKPLKARQAAEEILKTSPDNLSALTIKMFVYLNAKQLNEAKEAAKKIISITKDEKSKNYQLAAKVLTIDPNQVKPGQ